MEKKINIALVLVAVYLVVFFIGFKSGNIFVRMQKRLQMEKIALLTEVSPPPEPTYFIKRIHNYGTHTVTSFQEVNRHDPIMKIFLNTALRPLLKIDDGEIQIYSSSGERLY